MNKTLSVLAMLSLAGTAFAGASGGLPEINEDIDGNGLEETEGTFLRRLLSNPGEGGTISFSYAFMTSESPDEDEFQDVFRVRLLDITRGAVVAEFGGAVAQSEDYFGTFNTFNFFNPDLEGTVQSPGFDSVNGMPHFFSNGLIGWDTHTFTLDETSVRGDSLLMIEFLVADSSDTAVESGLAIDDLQVRDAAGAPISLGDAGFENGSFTKQWELEGEGGVYNFFNRTGDGDKVGVGDFFADEGEFFAMIATEIPTPGAASVGLLAVLAGLRRRR